MARKGIFSWFLFVGVLKAIRGGRVNMDAIEATRNAITNLTAIEWAHAVNSQQKLNDALKSTVKMIEADIVLGTLINDPTGKKIPVMGHPPDETSDISLKQFLRQILEHNQKNSENAKGVKLDFKSTTVFKDSLDTLNELWPMMNYPIWLNADILKGPVNATATNPVDASDFFAGCKKFNSAILSVGWTTHWGENFTQGSYSDNHVNEMLNVIQSNDIRESGHKITFPVRAGIAAQSLTQLQTLYKGLNSTNEVTLTIWSSKDDNVDIGKLRNLIFSFGIDKVYLDVPEEVASKLKLGEEDTNSGAIKNALMNFSIISLGMLLTSLFLQQYTVLN